MRSQLISRRDLDFLLYEWLRVEELTARPRFGEHSRQTFDGFLDLCEDMAVRHFAPHNKRNDRDEPSFDGQRVTVIPEVKAAIEAFAKADLLTAALDERFGGMQLPTTVESAGLCWFQAANAGTMAYLFLTISAANLLIAHGDEQQVERFAGPMIEGRFSGTMCLSEPQAGSSLADIVTRAEPRADGTYRIFGSKMWISGGDHELTENIVHLVLAKIPGGPPGTKGISLFLVPKHLLAEDGSLAERNDVATAGLNHKMGYRGTTNAALNFGEGAHTPGGEAGAIGYLIGEPHRGLSYMFHMMNEARLGVGLGATALGYTGYLKALDYARDRAQGRPLGSKDAAAPQVPIIAHADVKRMLLAQKSYVEGALALLLWCNRLVDLKQTADDPQDARRHGMLLEILTGVAKSWPSQWCLEANSLAMQVHGGYGYTREYDLEQHYRDNRLNPIHEGTHGIQGLDLLGRKVVQHNGANLGALAEVVGATIARAKGAGGELAEHGAALEVVWNRVLTVTASMFAAGDPVAAMANSTIYLEAFGHTVIAWIWLEQALAARGREGDFYEGKRAATRYFYRYELPRTGPQLDLLASLDRTTLEMDENWF